MIAASENRPEIPSTSGSHAIANYVTIFLAIHAYTQFFESFADEPLAYAIGGLVAIPLAWGMWRLNRWLAAQREGSVS